MINEMNKPFVVAVVGPTASGKTALSIDLAERFNGEVIACDSRTVYKYMDIGTAKPTKDEQKGIPHHLLDVADPDHIYTVAEYQRQGSAALSDILDRGKLPIVCGGTGFYSRALLEGLSIPEVAPQDHLRSQLKELAEAEGTQAVFAKLQELDPKSAQKIMPNDLFRIVRALEVTITLGRPFSEVTKKVDVPFRVIWIGLNFEDRGVLKKRIEDRLSEQVNQGLVEESRFLYEKYGPTQPIMNAVTYKEMINYFNGIYSLEAAVDDCAKHNYQLARKQIMWFRANQDTVWFFVDKSKQLFPDVINHLEQFL